MAVAHQTSVSAEFSDPVLVRIVGFLRTIGITVRSSEVNDQAFLPGLLIDGGELLVEESKLVSAGDLLHEAGHLALMPATEREIAQANMGDDAGFEMGAIAWSYAAAWHLSVDPAIVFHASGYRGNSQSLIEISRRGVIWGFPCCSGWVWLRSRTIPLWCAGFENRLQNRIVVSENNLFCNPHRILHGHDDNRATAWAVERLRDSRQR